MILTSNLLGKKYDKADTGMVICFLGFVTLYGISISINITAFAMFFLDSQIDMLNLSFIIAFQFLGGILISPFILYIFLRLKFINATLIAILLRSIATLIIGLSGESILWYIALFILGVSNALIITSIIFYISKFSIFEDNIKDNSMMILSLSIGFVIGIGLIYFWQMEIDDLLMVTSSMIFLLAIPMIIRMKNIILDFTIYSINYKRLTSQTITPLISIFVGGYILSSLMYFINYYNIAYHGDSYYSLVFILYIMFGILIFIIPAKHICRYFKIEEYLALVAIILCILLNYVHNSLQNIFYLNTILLYVGLGASISTIILSSINFIQSIMFNYSMIHSNGIMIFLYNFGCLLSVLITGNFITKLGAVGMIYSCTIVVISYIIYMIYINITNKNLFF